jgi:hypothetical protein
VIILGDVSGLRSPRSKRYHGAGPLPLAKEFGGLKLDQAKRLKELEKENSKLKRLAAELSLEKQVLKDIAEGNSKPRAASDSSRARVPATWNERAARVPTGRSAARNAALPADASDGRGCADRGDHPASQ